MKIEKQETKTDTSKQLNWWWFLGSSSDNHHHNDNHHQAFFSQGPRENVIENWFWNQSIYVCVQASKGKLYHCKRKR